MRLLLLLHALLLLLASTDFTVITATFGPEDSWRWCYFKYASESGWGYRYVSNYTLALVLTYLAAFAVGSVGFAVVYLRGRRLIGVLGFVLSVLGLISFGIEGSHWVLEHNRSWLAFSPAMMFVLVVLACLPQRSDISPGELASLSETVEKGE